uniref:chitin synthase n=1 Tax=Romanomermis culicivorax TaxID=13658 RepID=A0A915IV02_ROMCU
MDDDFLREESMAPPTEAGSSSDVSNSCSMTSLSMANSRADTIPKIYICATMWHETRVEMTQMLKSILKMDEDQSARKNAQRYLKIVDPDYYELEGDDLSFCGILAHIFFDDAWEQDEKSNDRIPNFYVKQFVDVIDHAASSVHKVDKILKSPVKIDVPYGGRLVWTLPGDNRLFVHLKDKTMIRNKKRWSQVMYMYYLFGHRIMEMVPDIHRKQILADNTYLLTIDGDSKFDPSSVQKLIDLMKKHNRLGSACGRIHPIGGGIMVLYQKFEYAIAHWFQKAAEHVFGCVLCSPGCFSLFRASALMDDNVMQKYTKLPTEPRHFVQYDQGEDRWLSTLLLKQGYRIEYAAAADAETYAPESFDEFFNQRRRPAIIFSMMIFAQVAAFRVRSQVVFVTNAMPVVTFCVLCFTAKSSIQLNFAKILSVIYAFLMMAVMVGTGIQITTEGSGSPITIYVFLTTAVFCWAACLHPKEFMNIFYGVIFFLMIPTTYLLMSLYSLINLNVVNWGTREAAQRAVGAEITETVVEKWLRKLKRKKTGFMDSPDSMEAFGRQKLANAENARIFCGCSNFFECFLCPQEEKSTKDEKLMWMGQQLETINEKLDHLTGEGSSKKRKEKPALTVTLPTPGRAQISNVSSNAVSPSKLRPMLGHGKFNVHAEPVSSDDADAESGDGTSIDSSLDDFGPPKPYRYDSQNGSTPKWMTLDYLNDCPHDILDEIENQFWVNFIEDHLKPLQKTPDEEIRVAKSLIVYRNQISFALLMANALLVLALYLAQMNKDIVAIKMMPSANYTIIKWDDKEGTFKASQEPLQVEALGLVIIIFLALILVVQTFGMFLHRWQTLQHIVASTVLPCFRRRASKKEEGHEILEGNAVEIAKRLQKLNDDDQGDSDGKIRNQGRHNIVFKLERARKRKHKSKCLQAAFQKRFFSFNPDKHRKSLRGIQFDKNNALFQKESTRKAAAVELKRRRDSILQQDASDLERKISLGLSKEEPSREASDDRRKFLTTALHERFLKPTKLSFDVSDKSSNEMEQSSSGQPSTSAAIRNEQSRASGSGVSNQSDLGNKSNIEAAGAGQKTVSFLADLERILKNRRLPPKSP